MTPVQRIAQIFGAVFLAIGVLGFFWTGTTMVADPTHAPRVLGLFPMNALHNLVHLAFGVWGLLAARTFGAARGYAQIAGILYLILAVLGFIAPSTFGLLPIGSHNIWLHALIGGVLTYYGFTARPAAAPVAPRAAPPPTV
jgi:hypothetical protein